MAKKIECEVVRNGFVMGKQELPVGEIVELTERQVKAFVGKIKPLKEIEAEKANADKSLKGFKAMADENKALKAKIEKLEEAHGEKIAELNAEIEKLKAEAKSAKK